MKVLIFNSNGKTHVNEFSYNNNIIQTVSKYCYLRVMLKCENEIFAHKGNLPSSARHATFDA
jgi:hypothetical protein